jgi:hypothetical protein
MNILNRINLKLFFFFVVPASTLLISGYKYLIIPSEIDLNAVVTLTFGELAFPYITAAIWIFLYSTVRGNLMKNRTDGIKSSGLDFLFLHDDQYMNFQNYQLFVFMAWLISLISQLFAI